MNCTCDGILDTDNDEESESSDSEPADDASGDDELDEIERLEQLPFEEEDGVYYGSDDNN